MYVRPTKKHLSHLPFSVVVFERIVRRNVLIRRGWHGTYSQKVELVYLVWRDMCRTYLTRFGLTPVFSGEKKTNFFHNRTVSATLDTAVPNDDCTVHRIFGGTVTQLNESCPLCFPVLIVSLPPVINTPSLTFLLS